MAYLDTSETPGYIRPGRRRILLVGFLASGLAVSMSMVQWLVNQGSHTLNSRTADSPQQRTSHYRPASVPSSAKYYQSIWGIDNLMVRQTSSGSLIRFSYRVLDPARAKVLADVRATPYLYGQRSHALLQIPVLENIGALRQARTQQAGKRYWMTFSNKGQLVKAGDRVDVLIGAFHVEGLTVE